GVRTALLPPAARALFPAGADENLGVGAPKTGARQHVLTLADPERPDTYQSATAMYPSAGGKTLVAFSYYYAKGSSGPRYQETLITGWDTAMHKQLFLRRRPGIDSWLTLSPDARVLAVPHAAGGFEKAPAKGPMRLEDL